MAKDPAFLFYPGDWHLGTMHLNLLEKGCYLELLMLQFSKGKFTLANAKHMLRDSFNVAWPSIKDKFLTDGIYFWNQRLADEKIKRSKFTESRRLNGSRQKKTYVLSKNKNKHMQKHMENEDENKNGDRKENESNVRINLKLPHHSEKFQETWYMLINMSKWKRKSESALKMALHKLERYNEGDAITMMENSIAGDWQGLFELQTNFKSNNNGKSKFTGQRSAVQALDDAASNILSNPDSFNL
ncbi:MAG TPA: hypothetical protein PLU73_02760 [Bacteroidia bacterium]|nr:hypothetical protein [Bacteroidia bacterium]